VTFVGETEEKFDSDLFREDTLCTTFVGEAEENMTAICFEGGTLLARLCW
jgi:hypothetical protein